ncbi:MAG TPA: CoA-binding protein [Anaeromyxobacter sp.]|nr:CoA-binding protein [Anaeromyxobacter sp.]
MTTEVERARRFLALRRFALVGVSRDPADFSRRVLAALEASGLEVIPVNPAAGALEGRRCFARLADVTPPVEGALVMLPAAQAEAVTREAIAAGLRRLWFHRGTGPGAASPAALALCAEAGVEAVSGLCPFMVLPEAGRFHRVHAWFRRLGLARKEARAGRAGRQSASHHPGPSRGERA